MDRRSDALVSAAQIIAALPGIASDEAEGTVITTGRLNVFPNGANVIPDKVVFSIDIRSGKEAHVLNAVRKVEELIAQQDGNGIRTSIEQQLYIEPKELNSGIRSLLKEASDHLKIPYCSINSGAGHDAMVFSDFTACGMLFIPSKDGLSHCPKEWSDAGDLADGTTIIYEAVTRLTEAKTS